MRILDAVEHDDVCGGWGFVREVGHSAFVYGVTGKGAVLALYPSNFQPKWIAHDAPLLAAA